MHGVVAKETPFEHVIKLTQSGSAGSAILPDVEGAQGSEIVRVAFSLVLNFCTRTLSSLIVRMKCGS